MSHENTTSAPGQERRRGRLRSFVRVLPPPVRRPLSLALQGADRSAPSRGAVLDYPR